jgi:hypothetical protein
LHNPQEHRLAYAGKLIMSYIHRQQIWLTTTRLPTMPPIQWPGGRNDRSNMGRLGGVLHQSAGRSDFSLLTCWIYGEKGHTRWTCKINDTVLTFVTLSHD